MAEQAVKHSPYVSEDPQKDFARFKDTLRAVVSVKKEDVDKSIAEETEQKQQRKEEAKHG